MKKSLLISGMFVAATLVSQSALAEIKIRAGAGSSSYELGGDYITAKSTYNPTAVGLTYSSEFSGNSGWYLDAGYSSGTGKHDGWAFAGYPDRKFKRSDYALTGGVVFLNQENGIAGNFYVGIKGGTTTLGAEGVPVAWTEETFDTAGVIFGGGASFPVAGGRAGSVGVNLGLGLMSATWKDNRTVGTFEEKADTAVGGSIGASYTFPFTSNFGVTADYKYQSYSYKFCADCASPFTVSEKFSTLSALLYAKF